MAARRYFSWCDFSKRKDDDAPSKPTSGVVGLLAVRAAPKVLVVAVHQPLQQAKLGGPVQVLHGLHRCRWGVGRGQKRFHRRRGRFQSRRRVGRLSSKPTPAPRYPFNAATQDSPHQHYPALNPPAHPQFGVHKAAAPPALTLSMEAKKCWSRMGKALALPKSKSGAGGEGRRSGKH